MMNVGLLEEKIRNSGMTQAEFCRRVKLSETAFLWKMKCGTFKTKEAERISEVLGLTNPAEIFFSKN